MRVSIARQLTSSLFQVDSDNLKNLNIGERRDLDKFVKHIEKHGLDGDSLKKFDEVKLEKIKTKLASNEKNTKKSTFPLITNVVKRILGVDSKHLAIKIREKIYGSLSENTAKEYRGAYEAFNQLMHDPKMRENIHPFLEHQVLSTLSAFLMITESKEEIKELNTGKRINENPGLVMMYELTGLIVHPLETDLNTIVDNCGGIFINAFNKAQERGDLDNFFMTAFDITDACLEARVARIVEYSVDMIEIEAQEQSESSSFPISHTEPGDVGVDSAKNNEQVLGDFLQAFLNNKKLEFAKDKGIDLSENFETKIGEIEINDAYMEGKYATKAEFLKFVEEAKLTEKLAITQSEMSTMVQNQVDFDMLGK